MHKRTTLQEAHKHSSSHRDEITKSENCGCFYCKTIFPSTDIREWIDEDDGGVGQTALCPQCGVDSVICDKSGYSLTPHFLSEMHRFWFDRRESSAH